MVPENEATVSSYTTVNVISFITLFFYQNMMQLLFVLPSNDSPFIEIPGYTFLHIFLLIHKVH